MNCVHCKQPLPSGAAFCQACGRSTEENIHSGAVGAVCPNCGMSLPKQARFCVGCGHALTTQVVPPAQAPVPPPPRRQSASGAVRKPQKPAQSARKPSALFTVLPLLALLMGVASAFRDSGGFSLLSAQSAEKLPPGIELRTLNSAELPSFQPVDDSAFTAAPEVSDEPGSAGANHELGSSAGVGPYSSTDQWHPFPHASFAYMQTEEDYDCVYSIRPRNASSWQGDILVLDKESCEVTAIQLLEAPPEAMVYAFTLVDEYLYFSVVTDAYATSCAYFRASKHGGVAEFLFIEETAFMTSYQGHVLLMFSGQGSLGVYSSAESRLSMLPLLESSEGNDWLYSGFSVHDGVLYYGQHGEYGSRFCARPFYPETPNIGPRTVLIESPDTITDVVYDLERNQYACTAYNLYDYQYELRFGDIGGGYQAPLQFYIEDYPFAARHGDSVYAQSGGQLIEYFLDGTDTGAHTYHYPLDFSPVGICREFLFFPNEVRRFADGSIIQQGELTPGEVIVLQSFDDLRRELEATG